MEFQEFQKIARLSRDIVVTEKIDGTNAQIVIAPAPEVSTTETRAYIDRYAIAVRGDLCMRAGSRTRYITPTDDNFGFAKGGAAHADELWALGVGQHVGEWGGQGSQRGYGLTEKRFSLFNVTRWADVPPEGKSPRPSCCSIVPTLYRGPFDTLVIDIALERLRVDGSVAAPGFMKPEGVVIFHEQARILFKKTIEKDAEPKSVSAARAVAAGVDRT